ncbi:MAG: YjiH family protein [Defluviitaleaceae bacterium]|nr:YjiH family protein [Defluviitaleaceae bacterium]MCL2240886.1 YjiH family protein [Defluviitaleaceae bacterium]
MNKIKFIIMSLLGIFLFMVPLRYGDGRLNIPLGHAISWLGRTINQVEVNGHGLLVLIGAIIITLSFLCSVFAYVFKPKFIMESEKLRGLFHCNIVYFVSKAIAAVLVWLVFFGIGPDWLIGWDGGTLMLVELIGGGSALIAIFLVVGIAIPILIDFGLMEFLGTLIRKAMRGLFTLPGRSSIDLIGSWFSSSAASVIITRDQHERGFYTGREAAAICVNFTLVSLPFTFVVAGTIDMLPHFGMFYLVICITAILLAILMPRIWPLRGIKDEYLPEVGKQIQEEPQTNRSLFSQAVGLAEERASKTGVVDVIKAGASNWLNIFMDLIPVIMAWGTIALVINFQTPIFEWLSWPFGQLMRLFQIEQAMEFAPAVIVGFIDMFIPALLLEAGDAPFNTRFIIGALSIVQIIYLAETGILILKSKIPLNIGHLFIIFLMRTLFALPIIVLLTWLIF